MHYNLLICGLGGQGILTLSGILGRASVENGLKAIVTMDRGLSQRGGSVKAHIRLGEVFAPMIPKYTANGLLSLEIQETFGYLDYICENTAVVVSTTRLTSGIEAAAKKNRNPDWEVALRQSRPGKLLVLDAEARLADRNKSARTNIYLLGMVFGFDEKLSGMLPFDVVSEAVAAVVGRDQKKNKALFRQGYEQGMMDR